jgi:hypothetical protein
MKSLIKYFLWSLSFIAIRAAIFIPLLNSNSQNLCFDPAFLLLNYLLSSLDILQKYFPNHTLDPAMPLGINDQLSLYLIWGITGVLLMFVHQLSTKLFKILLLLILIYPFFNYYHVDKLVMDKYQAVQGNVQKGASNGMMGEQEALIKKAFNGPK